MILEDISGMAKPRHIGEVVKRAHQYIAAMRSAKKPVDHVTLARADYDSILKTINAARAKDPNRALASGLRIGEVTVLRGGA